MLRILASPELLEAIQQIAPDQPLHACAATMTDQLGFPDAAVFDYVDSPELFGLGPTAFDRIWELIEALDGEQDRLLAHEVLANDASWSSRAIAATVLLNFGEHDTTWHDLVSATIDPHAQVSGAAMSVLRSLIQMESNRPVRWDAAREPLMAVLDGTNPFAFPMVLRVLATTEIEPAFGRQLIRGAPDLLLAHVGAEHEFSRKFAIDLLKTVSGEDFGADPEAWSKWLNGPRVHGRGNPLGKS